MTPNKIAAGALGATALIFGGVDASVLNEKPLERIEQVAGYNVEARQIGNIVETTFPWKDQPDIKVKLDLGEPTVAERFNDKRKKEAVTEVVYFGDGGFKIDILLSEKPATNVFCYAIEGAENYDFFYQPPLTDEEIAAGDERPEEIVGSYAVYHKELKNHRIGAENYATGKVMHIPRPQVWEVNDKSNTTQWADLLYDDGSLCVTASQEFLDTASYPVRIDPTFGYTTKGASATVPTQDQMWFSSTGTASINGQVDSVSVYMGKYTAAASNQKGIIIDDSDKTLLADAFTPDYLLSTAEGWKTLSYVDKPLVVDGENYRAGFINSLTNSMYIYYDFAGTADSFIDTSNSYSSPTDPTDGSVTAVKASVYATYNPVTVPRRIVQ